MHDPSRIDSAEDPEDKRRFDLGRLVATPGVLAAASPAEMANALRRHQSGDWGDLDADDAAANENALVEELRILSVYRTASGTRFYIITEHDRSVTTLLLPSEY